MASSPQLVSTLRDVSHPASFRDPAGFIFRRDGVLYRQVAPSGLAAYRDLMDSALYAELTGAGLLIPHEEVTLPAEATSESERTLRPEPVTTISYPYEWAFGQLKDAALTTLEIQRRALEKNQWLKDASAYNIQFHEGRPVLIDTLSFEPYREGNPWPAYKQFCQHFLAPLALMAHVDVRLSQLLRVYIDGVPLDLASRLLPWKTRFKPGLLTHIHLHASAQQRFADESKATKGIGGTGGNAPKITRIGLLGILDGLRSAIAGLEYAPQGTVWGDYYDNTNYTDAAMKAKHESVAEFLDAVTPKPATAWDLGANNGAFSRLAAERGMRTVAWDIDPAAVEQNWRAVKARGETRMLPLVQDLTNPSPGQGWAGTERESFTQRGPADVVLALALIHHLAISNNVPLAGIADLFAEVCANTLIVEWVPAADSQAQRLLAQHDGPLESYRLENFLDAFGRRFAIAADVPVAGTQRRLYRMKKI